MNQSTNTTRLIGQFVTENTQETSITKRLLTYFYTDYELFATKNHLLKVQNRTLINLL